MPLAFHADRNKMFDQQYQNARDYVIPFISNYLDVSDISVLDIGCAGGGVLRAFSEIGCQCVGVDLNPDRITFAKELVAKGAWENGASFVVGDIHDPDIGGEWQGKFDLVVLKDVIEHVPEKERLMDRIQSFLRPGGMVFFGFPPWRMPYGGHQQIAQSTLGKLPYYHLLPRKAFVSILKFLGESEAAQKELGELRDTRLSIAGIERLARDTDFGIVARTHYLFNPIYRFKFGLPPREQLPVVRSIPWFRDFVTTACYYLLTPGRGNSSR
jgi:SAM-dependent methyltransferase